MPSKSWLLPTADPHLCEALERHLHCPSPISHLLVSRGISTATAADAFFTPSLAELHSPFLMLGMDLAVARIQRAVAASEPILIYGDYDVDGTTATVLLKTAIERIAPSGRPAIVSWHVPHRLREGYGMQGSRLAEAATAGVRLVISVDTGIRAFDAAAEARQLGLDLIVTDHHLPDDQVGVPDALAVLNPAQPGCPYPFKQLCGAAVSFKLAHALLLTHARAGTSPEVQLQRLNQVLLPSFLKLVAIATIADSVPLVGENRILASLGLGELAHPVQPGLRALLKVAAVPLDRPPTAAEVGFRIAPRINAAGRMDIADDVIELLLTRDPDRATELAAKLDTLNEDRRRTEHGALETIEQHLRSLVASEGAYPAETLVLDHPGWHRGVIGILASRVVERTGRPALVLTHEDHQAHGSGRSISGFHLLDALTAVHAAGCEQAPPATLFTRFGGHAHAVGFSLPSHHVALLRQRLKAHGAPILTGPVLHPPLLLDAEVPLELLNQTLCNWIDRCGPYGKGHPEPVFLTRALILRAPVRLIKDIHIALDLVPASAASPLRAVGWSRSTNWANLSRELGLHSGSRIDVAYRPRARANAWFTGVELEIVDLRPAAQDTSALPGPIGEIHTAG